MFCPNCFIEYDDNEDHMTHCPICDNLLITSAFAAPVFDDEGIDYDLEEFDGEFGEEYEEY